MVLASALEQVRSRWEEVGSQAHICPELLSDISPRLNTVAHIYGEQQVGEGESNAKVGSLPIIGRYRGSHRGVGGFKVVLPLIRYTVFVSLNCDHYQQNRQR